MDERRVPRTRDRYLMMIKDLLLIGGALLGFSKWALHAYAAQDQIAAQISLIKTDLAEKSAKYIPMIEKHEIEYAVLIAQNAEIIKRLDRMR